MTKIAIIGNAGGGKSTLARKLGEALGFPVFEVDQLQWRPGWTRTPPEHIANIHDEWLTHPRWIIDGWGDWQTLKNALTLPIRSSWWTSPSRCIIGGRSNDRC